MKKTLALILALVMVAAILAGCSAKTAPAETPPHLTLLRPQRLPPLPLTAPQLTR